MPFLKKTLKIIVINLFVFFGLLLFIFLATEGILSLTGFQTRLDPQVYLKNQANQDQQVDNRSRFKIPHVSSQKVDPIITLTTNRLGMRGEDPPQSFNDRFSLMAMGGSTTACIVLSDGTTWVDLLGKKLNKSYEPFWYANAGVDGQSSQGHIDFLKSFIKEGVKPDVILFLIGANEQNDYYFGQENPIDYGSKPGENYVKKVSNLPFKGVFESFTFELFNFFHRYRDFSLTFLYLSEHYRQRMAESLNIGHHYLPEFYEKGVDTSDFGQLDEYEVHLKKLETRDDNMVFIQKELAKQKKNQVRVEENLRELIAISREAGSEPIFLTQPALFGPAIDPRTGVNLGRMILQAGNVGWGQGLAGNEMWTMLETYNDIIRRVAQDLGVKLIDMAQFMPKDSLYYYDYVHYTKPGAQKFTEILYNNICPYFKDKYPEYSQGGC